MTDLKRMTDEEIADLYRETILKSREARLELLSRGYRGQWQNPSRGVYEWRDYPAGGSYPDSNRFIKNEVIEEMKLVKTTVQKEI